MSLGGVMKIRTVRQRNAEAGNALVEFAITMVVILILLFGIVDVGRALFAYDWVSNAARVGARFAMVRGATCTGGLSGGCPAISNDVKTYIDSTAIGLNQSDITVTSTCIVGETGFNLLPCAPGTTVYVQVRYSFSFITPFIYHNTWLMSSSSEMVVSR